MKYDVVIIGSGLGGLQCAYTLAKKGLHVCVLEQNTQIGGCLQSFKRGAGSFDTGFHYVGGLEEGQSLYPLFRYFNLLDLPWKKLNSNCFDEIIINGESHSFANGHSQFKEGLGVPASNEAIQRYIDKLQEIGSHLFDLFKGEGDSNFYESPYFTQSAKEFLDETFDDELTKAVLMGASLKMQLDEHLPLYIFAQINNSFIESAWRLNGGGMQIAESLAHDIQKMGGDIFTRQRVTKLEEVDGKVTKAIVNEGEMEYEADYFISNAHPVRTNEWLEESKAIRKVYRKRISSIPNSFGMFTVQLQLKADCQKYINRNLFIYEGENDTKVPDLWHLPETSDKIDRALVSFQIPEKGDFTRNIDILTPMRWEEVERWNGTRIMQRGEEYEALKKAKAEACIKLVAAHIPGFNRDFIEKIHTSTPLTYSDYTGSECGAAYGMQKDNTKLLQTMLPVRTPISNLLQTGQNINLHGILGVSITSLLTCAEITGMEWIRKELGL